MRACSCFTLCVAITAASLAVVARADDELTLENVTPPAANRADEPLAESFSLAAAVRFLDQASLDWTKNRKCFTCHTNYSYLIARPAAEDTAPAQQQVRQALEQLVQSRWPDQGPRWDAEVVMSAAVLALHDAATTGTLHPATRAALERMWTVQREDGGFEWLKCNWPPMESDDHFGATMAAIAVGAAPETYRKTEAAQAGLDRLSEYFQTNPPPTLHHAAMLLWADSYLGLLLTEQEREKAIGELLSLQKEDGGWAVATMGNWQRSDGQPQDTQISDGYGTGFAIYVLRRSGLPADHSQLQQGIAWLKANQRASGRWFTRSLNKDNHHFLSHAGTAFAVLALSSCDRASSSGD